MPTSVGSVPTTMSPKEKRDLNLGYFEPVSPVLRNLNPSKFGSDIISVGIGPDELTGEEIGGLEAA